MTKILAFAGSNSIDSINHQLVTSVGSRMETPGVEVIRLSDYPLPMYSIDLENKEGFSDTLKELLAKIKEADGLIISVNEHNGTVSAFFKNYVDWLSRIDYHFLDGKKVLLLSTSPGKRGGLSALEYIGGFFGRIKANIVGQIPFPSFAENFVDGQIKSDDLAKQIDAALDSLLIA